VWAEAIIRMIYRDGFFHPDLHPGNLLVLPGPKAGFIDLGMVGRLHDELRRTLLYYYYSLVMGDAENAARYLAAAAEPGRGGDPAGFRRDVAEISSRWRRSANFDTFSLGQLIMESVTRGAEYRMFFPVEMVLMVKALITPEGVGQLLLPGSTSRCLWAARARVFIQQFSLVRWCRRACEERLTWDAMKMLLAHGRPPGAREDHQAKYRESVCGAFCGTLIAGFSRGGSHHHGVRRPSGVAAWVLFFVIALVLAVRRGS
jgi:predicted unusual protein kinase regulating ubiquinone biosynthesis (AarF/ABC1/UbiB family)